MVVSVSQASIGMISLMVTAGVPLVFSSSKRSAASGVAS